MFRFNLKEKPIVWSSKRNEGNEPQQESSPASPPTAAPQPVQRHQPAPAARVAMIGAKVRIKGEIYSAEELLLEGEVEGVIVSESVLTVGPSGKVKANVKAKELTICGSLRGNADVTGKIAIRQEGTLIGDIRTAGISIDDGAYFKGSIDIIRPEPKPKAE